MRILEVFRYMEVMMELEFRRIMHDRTELYTRAIQPILWLVLYGTVMSIVRAIPTGNVSYIAYITPGILLQSTTFVSVFFGLQMVWERESGVLKKLLTTPLPRSSIAIGRSMAAGIRSLFQILLIVPVAMLLGVEFINVLYFLLSVLIIFLVSGGFASLSIIIASFMKTRERFMGIGQAITMPLFFASNALYPVELMPKAIQYFALFNPMSYAVSSTRALMITGDLSTLPYDVAAIIIFDIVIFIIASIAFKRIIE